MHFPYSSECYWGTKESVFALGSKVQLAILKWNTKNGSVILFQGNANCVTLWAHRCISGEDCLFTKLIAV